MTGKVEAPQWSYQLGLQNGWMPKDPRTAVGTCGNTNPWQPPLQPWQTGGAGANQMPATFTQQYAWPPTSITSGGAATLLPSYTPTGPIPTLPVPTFSVASGTANAGNGWQNPSDTSGMMVPIPTCNYLDPWVGPSNPPPSPLCNGAPAKRVHEAMVTPPPS